jgi:hypothetical protein
MLEQLLRCIQAAGPPSDALSWVPCMHGGRGTSSTRTKRCAQAFTFCPTPSNARRTKKRKRKRRRKLSHIERKKHPPHMALAAGPEGVLSVAIGQRFQIEGKRLYLLLLEIARCFAVQATPENVGKVTVYRLVWTPRDPAQDSSRMSPSVSASLVSPALSGAGGGSCAEEQRKQQQQQQQQQQMVVSGDRSREVSPVVSRGVSPVVRGVSPVLEDAGACGA